MKGQTNTRRRAGVPTPGTGQRLSTKDRIRALVFRASPGGAPLMELREIAEVLQFSERRVYALAASGALPGLKRLGRRWFVSRVEFEAWLGLSNGSGPQA